MADTIREQIGAAFVTLIDGVGKPAALNVERGRVLDLDSADLPLTTVFNVRESRVDEELDEVLEWDLEIGVETTVKADGQSSDEELDPFLSWTHKAILADRRLGGLAQNVGIVSTQWEREQLAEPFGRALQVFRIKYHTDEDDPEAGAS
jgi:hypothetical protein